MKRIAVVSLLVAVLFGCHTDRALPPGPNAAIFDAGHGGGNPFFAFLEPLASQPTTNGVFDQTLTPTVRVELLTGLCSNVPIVYTMTSGPASDPTEIIRVNPTDHYKVNLHTDKVPLSSGCTYRIRVLVGATELGYADIALLLTMKEARNLTTNETLALVDGRTLPVKFWIAGGALCRTGADCGQGTLAPDHDNVIVTQNQEAGVFVPAGAVTTPTTIIIESSDRRPCFDGLFGKTFQGSTGATDNSCYQFRTDPLLPNGRFNTEVVVGICVDLDILTSAQRAKIQILQFDAGEPPTINPLPNVPAPFLSCNGTGVSLGKPTLLDRAARLLASLLGPRPAFASTRSVLFHVGAGGSTCCFSTFTWGLVTDMTKNDGDLQSAFVGDVVATPPSVLFTDSTDATVDNVPVTFSVVDDGGMLTGANTLSDLNGIATVGSWRLGSEGTNTLIASAPPTSSVRPTFVMFTATGLLEGAWTAASALPSPHRDQTATLLNNGDVLLIGGTGSAGALIYDHTTGTFAATAGAPLYNHGQGLSATRLSDGRVLIAGGKQAPSKTELYDPSTGLFTATSTGIDTMVDRSYHSATVLPDGRVLLAGGQVDLPNGVQTFPGAQIYDPATNGFTYTGDLNTDRSTHAAVLVNGKVLIVGGIRTTTPGFGNCVQSTELYDPATGIFTNGNSMTSPRCGPDAVLLPRNGKVLVVGGSTTGADLYDPASGTFSATDNMFSPHNGGTATLLNDGRVLVAGGSTAVGPVVTNVAEIYNPSSGLFTRAARLLTGRQEYTATLLQNGAVLVTGGFNGTTDLGSAELYTLVPPIP